MRLITLFTMGLFLFTAGCAPFQKEKAITIVNAAAVDAPLLERIRAYAEQELRVPVRALEKPDLAGKESFPRHSLARASGWQAMEKAAQGIKTDADVTLIVLTGFNNESQHLAVYSNSHIAVVNVQPLYTDDAKKFGWRVERQVMRAAAFSFGLEPTPDPFCVTRDYDSLEDLDSMGRNFSPPWQGRFADEAAKRGLIAKETAGDTQ